MLSAFPRPFTAILFIMTLVAPAFSGVVATDNEKFSSEVMMIVIDSEVTLEIINWGGKGEVMMFLAGLGHAAHVFDEFAPRFCNSYHVMGLTRRGFGASSGPDRGYDITRLTNDIRVVLDRLRIDKVILVGHSLGGDEMTKFAGMYPDRVKALIYIEAAYDRVITRDSLANYPDPPSNSLGPTEADLASVSAYREYYFKTNGVKLPESEFLAIYNWNADGSLNGSKTPGRVYQEITGSLEHPRYDLIMAPVLAIYAVDYPITELYVDYFEQDSLRQSQMLTRYQAGQRLDKLSRDQFRKEMKNAEVVELEGAGHSLYITHADQAEEAMRSFLNRSE